MATTFDSIKQQYLKEDLSNATKNFLRYFEENYINGKNDQEPAYAIAFWSTYERVLQEIPRTTNSLEAWHRHINRLTVNAHPNIARFIEVMKQEENSTTFQLTRLFNGIEIETSSSDFKKNLS